MSFHRRTIGVRAAAAALAAVTVTAGLSALSGGPAAAAPAVAAVAAGSLRIYNNNIENLVRNLGETGYSCGTRTCTAEKCESVSIADHFSSIATAADGKPDILIFQQVSGDTMAENYAKHLEQKYGDDYVALVAWDDDEMGAWGSTHHCTGPWASLGKLKTKQTNAIIYNATRLNRVKTTAYWSAGYLPNAADDKTPTTGECRLYKNVDGEKWRRTSAFGVKFEVDGTSPKKYVFAATMHLPQENKYFGCAGDQDGGWLDPLNKGSGMRFSNEATTLAESSDAVVVGIDANRLGLNNVSNPFGLHSAARADTHNSGKIDYLFATGAYSDADTRTATKSNHQAIFAKVPY